MMTQTIKHEQKTRTPASLSALTAAALVLPGLFQTPAHAAADDDSVDFQFSHYQEGKRDIYGPPTATSTVQKLPQNLNPIEVDSIHGSGRFTLTDRIKFAFNYTQDTWAGATPIATAPALAGGNGPLPRAMYDKNGNLIPRTLITGASPYLNTQGSFFTNKAHNLIYDDHQRLNNQLTHVLSYASPETRKQSDFKLSYAFTDEVVFDIGGGISVENDYESRFGNIGGRIDFNQKLTTVNWGLSYTKSDTTAKLDPDALPFFNTSQYDNFYILNNIIQPKKTEVAADWSRPL